jgi:penicillin V acylase-like amidase (Ntn superfamily)
MFKTMRLSFIFSAAALLIYSLILIDPSSACSRILWNTNKRAVVVARSTDWDHPFGERLVIYPRGIKTQGGASENSLTWVSKYGSIGVVTYEFALKALKDSPSKDMDALVDGNMEGMNEKGLAAHLLYLHVTKYEERDVRKPGITCLRWLRYVLDNFETVNDAVAALRGVQIVPAEIGGIVFPLHIALDDPTGDSAIIEFIEGNMVIHHGREHTVMTNEPAYPVQMANLKRYKLFGGSISELPGGVEPGDRFVRASTFLKTLPEPKDRSEAVAYLYSVIRNVSVPFGASYRSGPGAGTYPTWWTSASDLKDQLFYFNWTSNPNVVWVNLNAVDFSAEKPLRFLDPRQTDLVGDVTEKFMPASAR